MHVSFRWAGHNPLQKTKYGGEKLLKVSKRTMTIGKKGVTRDCSKDPFCYPLPYSAEYFLFVLLTSY